MGCFNPCKTSNALALFCTEVFKASLASVVAMGSGILFNGTVLRLHFEILSLRTVLEPHMPVNFALLSAIIFTSDQLLWYDFQSY
jgi:hypothetical protein